MTGPEKTPADGGTAEQPVVAPSVTTAPAHSGPFSRIPSHLGRARTSTVVLATLFVGIFALYMSIKPPAPGTASDMPAGTGTEQPAIVPTPTTTAPETSEETPSEEPTDTTAPTTASEETPTEEPTDTTVPEETSEPTPPTSTSPSSRENTPTLGSPPG